jgi:hypothetical protein
VQITLPGGITPTGSTTGAENSQFQVFETTHANRQLWAVHGILLFIAWGICAPIGIGASIVRNIFPKILGEERAKGLWYKIHFYSNVLVALLTTIGFLLAVIATSKEDGALHSDDKHHKVGLATSKEDGALHFDDKHHKVGLAIFIIVVMQAGAGYFRPGMGGKSAATNSATHQLAEVDDDEDEMMKNNVDITQVSSSGGAPTIEMGMMRSESSTPSEGEKAAESAPTGKPVARLAWEYSHRLFGMVVLGMAWYNCHSGIELHVSNYEDQNDYTGAFWGVTGGISGLVFILAYVVRV